MIILAMSVSKDSKGVINEVQLTNRDGETMLFLVDNNSRDENDPRSIPAVKKAIDKEINRANSIVIWGKESKKVLGERTNVKVIDIRSNLLLNSYVMCSPNYYTEYVADKVFGVESEAIMYLYKNLELYKANPEKSVEAQVSYLVRTVLERSIETRIDKQLIKRVFEEELRRVF